MNLRQYKFGMQIDAIDGLLRLRLRFINWNCTFILQFINANWAGLASEKKRSQFVHVSCAMAFHYKLLDINTNRIRLIQFYKHEMLFVAIFECENLGKQTTIKKTDPTFVY